MKVFNIGPITTLLLLQPSTSFVLKSNNYVSSTSSVTTSPSLVVLSATEKDKKELDKEADLFDYFDPLLSPHAYPDGIHAPTNNENNNEGGKNDTDKDDDDRYDPLRFGGSRRQRIEQQQKQPPPPPPRPIIPTEKPKFGFTLTEELHDMISREVQKDQQIDNSEASDDESEVEEEEVDLLDVFDPRISPHKYPNGIPSTKVKKKKEKDDAVAGAGAEIQSAAVKKFGFVLETETETEAPEKSSPPETKPFGFALDIVAPPTTEGNKAGSRKNHKVLFEGRSGPDDASTAETEEEEVVDILEVFDPLLSPHMYPDGIPSTTKKKNDKKDENINGSKTKTIGLLLIDHGSRNAKSNERLQTIAKQYQKVKNQQQEKQKQQSQNEDYIVLGAHMEIVSPSIPEQIQSLIQEHNVDEIICHPFFLSPYGRHVSEDIPQIIDEAMIALREDEEIKKLPKVSVTEPTGFSNVLMINIIDSIIFE